MRWKLFVITNLRTVRPFLGHVTYSRHSLSVVQQNKQPNIQLYCTKGERILFDAGGKDAKLKDFTFRERPPFRKSVFAAGTAKRTADFFKRQSGVENEQNENGFVRSRVSFIADIPEQPLTASKWRTLKENSPKPERFELRMMEALLAAGADLGIAKSLLTYVAMETGSLPYELLLRYLTFCVSGGYHSEVSDTYDIMKNCFKNLDTGAYTLLMKGFSKTEHWREALVLLEDMKKFFMPSPRNYGDAIAGAVLHGDREMGWTLYSELLELGLTPRQDTWQCLFESATNRHDHKDKLLAILSYMRENQVFPEKPLARSIKVWFESLPDEKWKGSFSSVDPRGQCRSCQANLESIRLTEEEYAQLKHSVMADVIEGRDVFKKTTPEELEIFKAFVKKRPAFDVVIDGLNMAHVAPKCSKSETLLAVVTELEEKGLNILVLGRKHMLHPSRNWNKHEMNQIKKKAHCFFTENISEDDPFLLYAALHSGNQCNFVSRDLMRDHKACLYDSTTRRLFFKWQRGHQLVASEYIPRKRVHFQRTSVYDTIVQTMGTSWHIPYDEEGGIRSTYEVPQKWLCLNKEH
ncbi:mitochondrial ribonuclease P catalytic subunit [Electrophorus electricus]|uniref:mitochondrial ribonuclease P catalytic subunit n=1 Tax=Electrophorus electricus TaxID=8005 RepID=UPI0015D06B4F|nr:mitochondrial ribonuclease P catalytic subunit [Electrophorus electricus]